VVVCQCPYCGLKFEMPDVMIWRSGCGHLLASLTGREGRWSARKELTRVNFSRENRGVS
jgi:hypothetical protein